MIRIRLAVAALLATRTSALVACAVTVGYLVPRNCSGPLDLFPFAGRIALSGVGTAGLSPAPNDRPGRSAHS
jgi:hypothetical protein